MCRGPVGGVLDVVDDRNGRRSSTLNYHVKKSGRVDVVVRWLLDGLLC